MKPRVAINGFGRIGRMMFRCNLLRDLVDIVAINDLSPAEIHAHLLTYDSTYGRIEDEIKASSPSELVVNEKKITLFNKKDPSELPWKNLNIDIVLEATGAFTDRDGAQKHITAGAKRVLITAPAKNPDATFILGVNDSTFNAQKHFILSNASCTTNCLAPLAKVFDETYGIQRGFMTTIHSYTNDQKILDLPHKDLRRARAAGLSLIPTTTGAARAIGEVLPHLTGKLNGIAIRAPTPTVSVVDFVCDVEKAPKDATEVNDALRKAASGPLKNILYVEDHPLVSVDFKGSSFSSIVDSGLTMVIGNMLNVFSWYDNEWGYSMRTIELAAKVGK